MQLEVRQITAGYGSLPIIFDVDAHFAPGQVTVVIGPNGAGKSTLFKAIFGLVRVFSGEVLLDGKPISPISPRTLVRAGVAYVPQSGNVFPTLTVKENLLIGGSVVGATDLEAALDAFPILRKELGRPAGKLSGGQRNMLAVARALVAKPKVLLLDEVTAGLARMISNHLWESVVQLARSGVAVGVVEQNVRQALERSDRAYLLASGRNRLDAPAAELAARTDLEALFLEGDVSNSTLQTGGSRRG